MTKASNNANSGISDRQKAVCSTIEHTHTEQRGTLYLISYFLFLISNIFLRDEFFRIFDFNIENTYIEKLVYEFQCRRTIKMLWKPPLIILAKI